MKVLLHICCAPCAIVPVEVMRAEGLEVMGFFYRHNIHPYTEMQRRQETLEHWARNIDLKVIWQPGYDLEGFIRRTVFREAERCTICYHDRLLAAAGVALHGRFDAFTSTLLYSKLQTHDLIRSMGETVGLEVGVPFLYRDFRSGWKDGIVASMGLGMYRQQYCGCIYSEKARYGRPSKTARRALRRPVSPEANEGNG